MRRLISDDPTGGTEQLPDEHGNVVEHLAEDEERCMDGSNTEPVSFDAFWSLSRPGPDLDHVASKHAAL